MLSLIVKAGGPGSFVVWQTIFNRLMPELTVIDWHDKTADLASIDYAFVWQPEPGRLAQMPRLKAILSVAAGVDHILTDPDLPANLPVIRMGGEDTAAQMQDYVRWAVFSLLREAPRWHSAQHKQIWARQGVPPVRLSSETPVGIMGLGALGSAVAQSLVQAGFPVVGWSQHKKSYDHITSYAGTAELETFLRSCSILVCLLPETSLTRGIITCDVLKQLQKPAGLINVGRGRLVVTSDLLRALDDGTLHNAVLDVFEHEPLPAESPLWSHPGVLITPHVASEASRTARAGYVVGVIRAFERGEDVPLRYDPQKGY
ncbi:2-hydroxyacid dehydrogenase [Acetobacter thailandicus]|uniref:Glyoxylate/hydroxypyruvate reductase A n=1 Tax=Acetobacter thailandicus TaxID=1502842 RepID=A0ABT3QEJ9_9PROT|nr:glyoxylate/hydroxypyruvate reductase A [Acetobacter thailandicus]MCX2563684.1 glyoxylate/hydroxypyruvate reductase A [Acetobacter thailandicus]NHN95243.1 glyoxylate/hydroxypyruvate reductase A [Acetobacter thailandicus]